jgi:hypothetical protein
MWPEALIPGTIYSSILFTEIRGLSTFFSNGVLLSLEIFGIIPFFYFRDYSGFLSVNSSTGSKKAGLSGVQIVRDVRT